MGNSHHHQHKHDHPHTSARKPFHRDWRVWTVVIIMLAAIGMYVLSNYEMLGFRVKPQPAQPAQGGK